MQTSLIYYTQDFRRDQSRAFSRPAPKPGERPYPALLSWPLKVHGASINSHHVSCSGETGRSYSFPFSWFTDLLQFCFGRPLARDSRIVPCLMALTNFLSVCPVPEVYSFLPDLHGQLISVTFGDELPDIFRIRPRDPKLISSFVTPEK